MSKIKHKLIVIFISVIVLIPKLVSCGNQLRTDQKNQLQSFIDHQRMAYNIPSVVVGITGKDSIIFIESFGDGSVNDLYLIGSNSKSFTALAILILQKDGMLNIDEKVIYYLPWFRYDDKEYSDLITIRDLLNHTSGIPRSIGLGEPGTNENIKTYFNAILKDIKVNRQDIGKYEYSNINYQLLGLIIETVSNKPYSDYVTEKVLIPLDMNNTIASGSESQEHDLIKSYQYLLYFPILRKHPVYSDYTVPSGFVSSTAQDMCYYLRAFMNSGDSSYSRLIDENISNQLFTPRSDIGSVYAMGWEVRPWKGHARYKHDGLTQSFSSSMLIMPNEEIGIIIMANINNSPATLEIADGILRILTGRDIIEYPVTSFYLRNSLPLFALWVVILLLIRLKKWIKLRFPIGIIKMFWPNLWLVAGIIFGLFWIIYFPLAFNTPLRAIVDYEPNSGYSLVILSIGIIISSLVNYFNRSILIKN